MAAINESFSENVTEYVTVMIADQLFGLPISCGAGSACRRA